MINKIMDPCSSGTNLSVYEMHGSAWYVCCAVVFWWQWSGFTFICILFLYAVKFLNGSQMYNFNGILIIPIWI